ncbi:hypothetical protein K1719_013584 [Acacia pycnantha]|nr:hypothetical protein K1719_013584 [Acacia pycnantha]
MGLYRLYTGFLSGYCSTAVVMLDFDDLLLLFFDLQFILDNGSEKIQAINLDMPGDIVIDWSGKVFKKIPNLKILIIRNAQFSTGPNFLKRDVPLKSCRALHEVDGLKFIVEEDKAPEWLDHYVEGDSCSFWFQNEFPNMAVCFGALIEDIWHSPPKMLIDVQVNGIDVGLPEGQTIFAPLSTPHIFLLDLRRLVLGDKLKSVVSECG